MDNPDNVPLTDELEGVENDEQDTTLNTASATAEQVGVVLEEGTGVNDEIDDEADVEGSIQSSVQIAPTGDTNPIANEENPMLFIQLGDRVVIDSKKYGRTIGNVYYRSLEFIRVKPDGVSNTLHSFELEQTDEEELFNEDDGVTAAYVIEKRKFESFVEQQDFRINQIIDTFDSEGNLYKSYKIVKVDKENDYIQIQDEDDQENVYDLNFDFTGISSDEDFRVISIRQLVAPDTNTENFKEEVEEPLEEEDVEVEEEDEIEVMGFVEIVKAKVFREALAYEQKIPDNLQKVDALNDFLSGLDPILQKDPKSIRAIRILVETLFNLKQETISYNDDGSVRGPKAVSASTLSDLIEKVPIPLGRPVLKVSKKEYQVPAGPLGGLSEEEDIEGKINFENFAIELNQMVENRSQIVSGEMVGAPKGQVVKEWINQQNFLKKYASPWATEETVEPLWRAISDSEFFRTSPPEFAEIDGTTHFLNIIPGYLASHEVKAPPTFSEIPFGIERALSTTYRKGVDRKKQVLLSEESATMDSYLIFPSKVASNIGTTRSTNLAIDSGRSLMPKEIMRDILAKVGTPLESKTLSNNLILVGGEDGKLGNIPLADYIEGVSIPALGLGDTFATLEHYGMENLELTPEIANVLLKKIELYQEQLLSSISNLRRLIETEAQTVPEQNPFIDATRILEEIRSQPTLVDDLQEYERINPSLASSDIGKVAYLMKKHPDYFQVAAGKNSLLIAKALLDSNNAAYLQSLKVANLLKYNKLNAGLKPKKNTCEHVAKLVAIRKIFDDAEKFQKLVEFFKLYQGERDNNWINCNKCKEHLLCVHERLQIQAYLNPKDKQIIEKEIILKFSGGSFQGKYICRNCGQAIRDLDFDNGIEFDDNGKPKSGRAVLVDEDAAFEEKLDILVSAPIEQPQKKELNLTKEDEVLYNIISEIAMRVGVALDNTGYKNIINKVNSWVNRFPNKIDYEESRKKRPGMPEYDIALNRNAITACATFLLLEIQTKTPSYPVKYALIGCDSPGFDGYPLESDIKNKQGILYVACAVASIRRNEFPWNQTGFQKVADDKKRQFGISIYIDNILKEVIGDDMLQAQLAEKRKYLEDIKTKSANFGGPSDKIPATFLPEQIIITPEEAAKEVITPEVVANMGNRGKQALVKLWIRQAHLLAKKTASLVRGSPLSETTCCLANIEAPGTFWASASDLPKLDRRILTPNKQGNMLVTEFIPREAGEDVAEPDKELYFRLFLKYCFQGSRFGYPHEPGLTNQCPWCGFQFPTIPSVMDSDTEGKTALVDVKTDTEEFTKLLDKIHQVNEVNKIQSQELMSVTEIMNELGAVSPSPILNWSTIVTNTTDAFLKLPPDADRGDIALAAGEISDATTASEQIIYQRLTDESFHRILEEIVNLSWINFFQVLQTYFTIPFQRIVSQFSVKSLFIPIELTKVLSEDHVEKDIIPILNTDTDLVKIKEEEIKKPEYNFAKSKLKYFLSQMSALLPIKNKVRPIVVPGRNASLIYIQRALLYGPLATLLNSAEIPKGAEIRSPSKSVGNPSMKFLLETIASTLNKYKRERLSFNDQEIRDLIAIRNEKERTNVIAEFNKLTDEERAIELTNKRLGLGKWAVGGTKLIYAYDKDYYDLERQKREAAGIIDFPGLGPDQMKPMDGRPVDEYGLPIFNDGEFEADGGYNFNQHEDDDYE
jgi:hypothetical protein